VQERIKPSGPKRGRRPCNLFWLAVVFLLTVPPAGLRVVPETYPAETAQLPVSLQRWERIETQPSGDALKAFKRAMEELYAGRYEAALNSFPDESAVETALGDYILFYRAKSSLALGRDREALGDFKRLESRYPNSPMVRESLMEQCQILLELNDGKSVLAILDSPKAGITSETTYYQARALEQMGEKEKSAELYLRIYSRYPTSKHSPLAEQYLVASSPGALRGARNYAARLQRAENFVRAGQYREARVTLRALGQVAAPDPASSQKRNLLFGEVEYRLGKPSAAIPYLRKIGASDAELHAKALYLEGACARRLEKDGDLLELRDRLLKLYPKSTYAEELCYSAATYFDVNYRASKARDAYAVLQRAFPRGEYAERSLWKLSLFSYLDKKYGEAALGFWEYVLAFPEPLSSGPALYWMGRCYEKLNGPENAVYLHRKARALANESYYGQLAREAETALEKRAAAGRAAVPGIDFSQVIAKCDAIQLPRPGMSGPDAAVSQVIARAWQLITAGMQDLALTELRWGRNQYPKADEPLCYAIARIYHDKRDHYAAISTLRKAFPDYLLRPPESLPREIWNIFFPVRHWEIISRQSEKLQIDRNLVLGLIRQESSFNESARSKANARGLMQILPSTGRMLARQSPRIPRYSAQKLYQPETNITLGTRFLSSLLRQLGKPELALAAYNAGKSRVDRWLEEWDDLDMAEFVEQIPFSETRGYVKQVLSNRARYGLLTSSAADR